MKILAIDYGSRRTGLAVTDDLGITAQGLDTLMIEDGDDITILVADTAKQVGAERIVVGLPLNMNGTDSEQTTAVRDFAESLTDRVEIPVLFWDERMTSIQAQRVMQDIGRKTKNNKHHIDRISATIILQDYLRSLP